MPVLMMVFVLIGASLGQVTLVANVPIPISNQPVGPTSISSGGFIGNYGAVGLASTVDYTLSLFGASSSTVTSGTEFLVNPNSGASSGGGTCTPSGPGSAVLEFATPQLVGSGSITQTSLAAGHVLRVLRMQSSSGSQDLLVTGDPSLRWFLFPTTQINWLNRGQRAAEGGVGGPGVTVAGGSDFALVVVRDGGVAATDLPFTARLGPIGNHFTLSGPGAVASNLTATAYQFTATVPPGRWTAVGSLGSVASAYTISIGNVTQLATTSMGYALANGRLGTISPTDGLLARSGTSAGTFHQATVQVATVGTPAVKTWSAAEVLHIFEFEIVTAGLYDLGATGPNGLGWAAFAPGNNATWRPRTTSLTSAFLGTTRTAIPLSTGWHAMVVSKSVAGSPSGPVTCTVAPTPSSPVPVLSSLSPSSIPAGSAGFTLTANGGSFVNAGSVLRWDGVNLTTTFVNGTQLTAAVPATLVAVAGTVNVTVFTPAPGGGTSVAVPFSIENPVPVVTLATPASVIAGGPTFVLNLTGSGFGLGATAFWNTTPLSTTVGSPTQLTASVPAALIASPGTAAIRIFNPSPGGGLSAPFGVTVRSPTITQVLSPSIPILVATSAPVGILISGTDFLPGAVAYADSTALPTVVFGSTLIQASIGPNVPGATRRGGLAIAVENGHLSPSNALGLAVGGGSNRGTIVRHPLRPSLGEAYSAVLESGTPSAPLVLLADLQTPAPVYPFPNASADFVLGVRPAAIGQPDWLPLIDSIGIYGAPFGPNLDAGGRLVLSGFVAPSPALGISLSLQGAYLDPTSPAGFRMTWSRFPDEL